MGTIKDLRKLGFSSVSDFEYDTDEVISLPSECQDQISPTEESTPVVEQLEVELQDVKERLTELELQLEEKQEELKIIRSNRKKAVIGNKRRCCLFPKMHGKKSTEKKLNFVVIRNMG